MAGFYRDLTGLGRFTVRNPRNSLRTHVRLSWLNCQTHGVEVVFTLVVSSVPGLRGIRGIRLPMRDTTQTHGELSVLYRMVTVVSH